MFRDRAGLQLFDKPPPDIVGVGGGRATVRGFLDVPLEIAGVVLHHPLIVVKDLAFPLLVGINILRAHAGTVRIGVPDSLKLKVKHCEVCLEHRDRATPSFDSPPPVASIVSATTIKPRSAALGSVRLLPCLLSASDFVGELIQSLLLNTGCAAIPAVCTVISGTFLVAPVNPIRTAIKLRVGKPVAAVHPAVLNSASNCNAAACDNCLDAESKLLKVARAAIR